MIADIIVGIVIILMALKGFIRGLIKEILFFVAMFLAFFCSTTFWTILNPYLKTHFTSPIMSQIISYAAIFIATFIAVFVIGTLIRKGIQITILAWVDRFGGAIVGFLKGAIICGLILILISFFWPNIVSKRSRVALYVMEFTNKLSVFIPKNLKKEFEKEKDHLKKYFSEDFLYEFFNIKKGKRKL